MKLVTKKVIPSKKKVDLCVGRVARHQMWSFANERKKIRTNKFFTTRSLTQHHITCAILRSSCSYNFCNDFLQLIRKKVSSHATNVDHNEELPAEENMSCNKAASFLDQVQFHSY